MIRPVHVALSLLLAVSLGLAAILDSCSLWKNVARAYRKLDPRAGAEEPIQIPTPEGGVDRCPTCHRAMLAEGISSETAPFREHPRIKGHEDLLRFGCTSCHGGQGRRLDLAAHEPSLGSGPNPFLRPPLIEARCARCHVPSGLVGAENLTRGFQEYLDAACNGCHQPGRREEGLGPDLRRLGSRSEQELRDTLLSPRKIHDQAVMWSLRWRFDQDTPEGRATLSALITALLAMSSPPAPYRNAWATPSLRVDVDCTGCHSMKDGGKATGRTHRCALLRGNKNLSCPQCHGTPETQVPLRGVECPQVRASRPLCGVCHLRSDDGNGRSPAR